MWFPHISSSSFRPDPSLSWKFQSSVKRAKVARPWPFYLVIFFIVLSFNPLSFRPIAEILKRARVVAPSLKPGPSLSRKISKFFRTHKIDRRRPFYIAICLWYNFMVLCIIPTNFRPIDAILKELKRQCRSRRTDGRTDRPTDGLLGGRMEQRQYPSAPMAAEGKTDW